MNNSPITLDSPDPKVQILDVRIEYQQESIEVAKRHLAAIVELAKKHNVRALLISPCSAEMNYDLSFALRRNDDTYYLSDYRAFTKEVEKVIGLRILPEIHSPDNPFINTLNLAKPYVDELNEAPVQ